MIIMMVMRIKGKITLMNMKMNFQVKKLSLHG